MAGELAPPAAGAGFLWSQALVPPPPQPTRDALLEMEAVFRELEQRPPEVSLERHAEAVVTLARLLRALRTGGGGVETTAAVEPAFTHQGVRCNCVYFELYHRVVYLAERFLWHVQRDDVGEPCHGSGSAAGVRTARAPLVRTLVALLAQLQQRLAEWRQQPLGLGLAPAYVQQLLAAVRAYGMWNAARAHLGESAAALPLAELSLEKVRAARAFVYEAYVTLDTLPNPWPVAGGAFALARRAARPTAEEVKAAERAPFAPSAADERLLRARPWTEAVEVTLLLLVAWDWSHSALHNAVALGHVLQRGYGQPVPALADWEHTRTVTGKHPLPTYDEVQTLARTNQRRREKELRKGAEDALETPLSLH